MLDRAPCTRNSGPAFSTDLAEWAPEAVMILLAASHKFLVRKSCLFLYGLSQVSVVLEMLSVESFLRLHLFWPDVQLTKKFPTPTRCKTFCHMATERSMVVYFVVS